MKHRFTKKTSIVGIVLLLVIIVCGFGCNSNEPEKTLQTMAKAMQEQDVKLFLNQIDLDLFVASQVQGFTKENPALNAIDDIGKIFGFEELNVIVNNVMDVKGEVIRSFTRGVSTGELILDCTKSQKPYCPWVPSSLANAKVKELSPTTAIAKITTPAGITSWLSMAKIDDVWKVSGQAVLERDAIALTLNKKDSEQVKSSQKKAEPNDPYAPAPPPKPLDSQGKQNTLFDL